MKLNIFVLLFCLVVIPLIGCSKQLKPDGFPPLYPVSVRIIQNGKPLEGATVYLYRKDDIPQKWGIIGETGNDGKAVFVTHGKFYGAPEGDYAVTVEKRENVNVPGKHGGEDAMDAFTLVEVQYVDKEKTPLQLHVQKKGKNYEEFDVGQPVHIFLERII